jgi:integrase
VATHYPKPWTPTGSGSYRELRQGTFEIIWRPDGHAGPKRRRRVDWKLPEILAFLASESDNRDRRRLGLQERVTWEDALDKYRARLEAKSRGPKYTEYVMDHLERLRVHCNRALEQIGPDDLEAWADSEAAALKKKKRKGWATSANRKLAMVAAFFNRLWRTGKIPAHPCMAVERYTQTKKLRRVPTAEQYAKVWLKCEPSVQDLLDWFLISAVRFGEIQKLKREHIIDGAWHIGGRKGKNDHRVHLQPPLPEILLRQKSMPDGLVFHRWVRPLPELKHPPFHAGGPLESGWLCDVLKVRCKWAGVQYFTAHCLRHAAASWTDEDLRKIQNLLGHTRIETTQGYVQSMGTKTGAERVQKVIAMMRAKAIQKQRAQ